MRECMLCKRNMKKSHDLFGSGCINYIYNSLDLDIKIKNKESYLCNYIKKQTNINNINKKEEKILIDRYLTLHLLNKLIYGNHEKLKEKINLDLISINSNKMCSTNDISLKEIYDLCKKQDKFNKNIKEFKKTFNDKQLDSVKFKLLISSFSFLFNLKKNEKQFKIATYKSMQFVFWQTVVEGGRVLKDYDISAYLLQHSLEEKPKDLYIKDGFIVDAIKEDSIFKKKLKGIVEKNKNKKSFVINEKGIAFSNGDLYYSIHGASITITGKKENNKWNLQILIHDTYDYDKIKYPSDYYFDTESVAKSLFSSTLYNMAHISTMYKVVKVYEVYIEFEIKDYEL